MKEKKKIRHLAREMKTIITNKTHKKGMDIIQDQDIINASNISNIKDNLNDLIYNYSEFPRRKKSQ